MNAKQTRRLFIVAFALSLLVHLIAVLFIHWRVITPNDEGPTVVHIAHIHLVRITRVPTPPPPTPVPAPTAAPKAAAHRPATRPLRPSGALAAAAAATRCARNRAIRYAAPDHDAKLRQNRYAGAGRCDRAAARHSGGCTNRSQGRHDERARARESRRARYRGERDAEQRRCAARCHCDEHGSRRALRPRNARMQTSCQRLCVCRRVCAVVGRLRR